MRTAEASPPAVNITAFYRLLTPYCTGTGFLPPAHGANQAQRSGALPAPCSSHSQVWSLASSVDAILLMGGEERGACCARQAGPMIGVWAEDRGVHQGARQVAADRVLWVTEVGTQSKVVVWR